MKINDCKASFSQIDITPDFKTSLIGCYRPNSCAQGVLHRLYAQVLLFQYKDDYYCLVAVDNLGLTVQRSTIIRRKISFELKTDITHIMLNFSHTHSAPEPTEYGLNGEKYFEFLCEKIMECVKNAKKNFVSCKVAWDVTKTNIGENRREDGILVDDRLGGLMVSDEKSRPIVVILRVTAHANILMTQNDKISSDYFSGVRESLQNVFGCPIMIIQGAAGNIKPIGVDKINGGDIEDLSRVVENIFYDAQNLKFKLVDIFDIQMFSKELKFISDIPTESEAKKIANDSNMYAVEWLESCDNLRRQNKKFQLTQAEVNFLKINDGCICGVADEIFCELAIDVKNYTNNPLVFLNGYTNGCRGYLPNKEEWHKGGYEVLFSNLIYYKYHEHVMPYKDETADEIVKLVADEWNKIKNLN